jgi:hypothetical protein
MNMKAEDNYTAFPEELETAHLDRNETDDAPFLPGMGTLFFLSAAAGAFLIYFNGKINLEYALYLPTGVVALYAGITSLVLRRMEDRERADHQIDSIYFLGFLFTLISLVSLFAGFSGASGAVETESIFLYLGISVSTSITGVLFRNIIRGSYLASISRRRASAGGDAPENSEQLLSAIADALAPMREYLSDRNEKRELLSRQEDAYLGSLERFIEATEGFSSRLNSSQELLGRQMERFSDSLAESEEGMRYMNEITSSLSLSAGEMERFSRGTGELNVVLDGLLEILEEKVGKLV